MTRPLIRIFSNLPRSGGTLLSRCLGCMERVVLLSEIHPLGAHIHPRFNPLAQAVQWHQLFNPAELPAGKALDFAAAIQLIADRCVARDKLLVIRDWAYLDYMGVPYNLQPAGQPQLVAALQTRFHIRQYFLVRHPVDQWLSICQGRILKQHLTVAVYLRASLQYARAARQAAFLRYEDFLQQPGAEMQQLCSYLKLDYDKRFLEKWFTYRKVTGDNFQGSHSFSRCEIRPPVRKPVPRDLLQQFRCQAEYRQLLDLLGYEDIEAEWIT